MDMIEIQNTKLIINYKKYQKCTKADKVKDTKKNRKKKTEYLFISLFLLILISY